MPRVVVTTNTLSLGGAERQRVALVNGLAQRGESVELRLLQSGGPLEVDIDHTSVVVGRPRNYAAVGRPGRGDVIITGTTMTEVFHGFLFKLASRGRAKWVTAVHNPTQAGVLPFPRSVAWGLQASDVVIYLSERQRADLSFIPSRTWAVIPNGIATEPYLAPRYAGRSLPDAREDQLRAPHLVFIGRLVEQKGLDLLLQALVHCLDLPWRLTVVGEGPHFRLKAEPRFSHVMGRTQWLGRQAAEDILWQADLLVAPSRNEAYPLVLLEAATAGVPFLATSVGAVPEIARQSASRLCYPEVGSITSAVRAALREFPELLRQAQELRLGSSERFDRDSMIDSYARLLAEIRT